MVRVILVRHGETDWNQARRIQGGGSNTQLNENGRQQAESLALRLKSEPVTAVYSSPLRRAMDTAQAIAGQHNLEVKVEGAFREIEVGQLEGTSIAEVGKHLHQLLTAGSQGEALPKMPGGESITDVQQRVWSAIRSVVSRHSDGVVVVVSHYFVILAIICAVLELPLYRIGRLRLSAGSISTVVFDGEETRLILFNDSCHLDGV